jgi:hypothetical protein
VAKKKDPAAVALGRKGGKNSRVNLTPDRRRALAKKAAAARWAKPVTQADLKGQADLQAAEWESDRAAQAGATEIAERLAQGAELKPGKLTFDRKAERTERTIAQAAKRKT